MALNKIIATIGSLMVLGFHCAEVRAQAPDRSQNADVALPNADATNGGLRLKLEQGLSQFFAAERAQIAPRFSGDSFHTNTSFLVGPSRPFSFTTGSLPRGPIALDWKHISGIFGAYALHRGKIWGVMPGLSLGVSGSRAFISGSAFAETKRLRGHTLLSFGMRF